MTNSVGSNRAWIVTGAYCVFLLLPLYWLLVTSLKTNQEILSSFTYWPQQFTLDNYRVIFNDPSWYRGYINSTLYVLLNTLISLAVALPAAYGFSRYRFVGDKHLFFWLLSKPHGTAGGFRFALFPALLCRRSDRYSYRCGARALFIQRAPCGVDSRRLYVRGTQRNR